jgi:YgiT-type zinc finger domain-containing protein
MIKDSRIYLLPIMSQSLRNESIRGPGGHKESTRHEYGDCSFCGGEVKEALVELDYRYKKQLYVFRDVLTGVCQQCKEKYLVASTAKAIGVPFKQREIGLRP